MESRVGRNATFNIFGAILPSLVGLIVIPIFLQNIGIDRLGVFTLALGILGFAGLFDFGLGRALTQTVAKAIGAGYSLAAVAKLVRNTIPIIFLFSAFWGVVLTFFANYIVEQSLHLSGEVIPEATVGIIWLAFALPVMVLTSCIVGVLEGLQFFGRINLIRTPAGILSFLVPAIGSYATNDVGNIIGLLVAARTITLLAWIWALYRALPQIRVTNYSVNNPVPAREMWKFTGWMTISNIVGPFMVHADRFYLASIFPPSVIAYYTVPIDTLFRTTIFPLMAMNAVFPAFANAGVTSAHAGRLLRGATLLMLFFWAIPLIGAGLIAEWLLSAWVGSEFAGHSLIIVKWLLLGILINGFAHIPFALLQSGGRADLTAKLHMLELPIYLFILVSLVASHGIIGAALAWTFRVMLDTTLLYGIAANTYRSRQRELMIALGIVWLASVVFFFLVIK